MLIYKSILDKISASSMTNKRSEIEYLFKKLKFKNNPSDLWSYYQGCGPDICTLAIDGIDNHVFCDYGPHETDNCLHEMAKCGELQIISKTSNSWLLNLKGVQKNVFFTDSNITSFDFNKKYGKLGLVFNFNSGDSTYKRIFWESISKYLMPDGFVIGDNAKDVRKLNRQTMFLFKKDGTYNLYDDLCDVEESSSLYSEVLMAITDNKIQSVPNNQQDFPFELLKVKESLFLVRITEFECGEDGLQKIYQVKRIKSSSLQQYGLKFLDKKNSMTLLQKIKYLPL